MPASGWLPDVVTDGTIASAWGNDIRNRTITPFANAAARTAAIPTPIQGMATYQIDTKRVEYYDGAAWIIDAAPYQSFTPTISAQGGSPTLGNGTAFGRYVQIGKTVHAHAAITVGSTTSFGTGVVFLTLPVALPAGLPELVLGSASAFDSSASLRIPCVTVTNATTFAFFATPAGTGVSGGSNVPFTWTTGDVLSYDAIYEGV